jgi:hypothetical protein
LAVRLAAIDDRALDQRTAADHVEALVAAGQRPVMGGGLAGEKLEHLRGRACDLHGALQDDGVAKRRMLGHAPNMPNASECGCSHAAERFSWLAEFDGMLVGARARQRYNLVSEPDSLAPPVALGYLGRDSA